MAEQAKYYAISTVMGRELDVALVIENRSREKLRVSGEAPVTAIILPPASRGYVFLEARSLSGVYELVHEIKYVRPRAPLKIAYEEIERMIKPPSIIELIREGEIVEIVRGPFREMRAMVISIDKNKNTVLVKLLDATHEFFVEIPSDYVKLTKRE